ncbi:cingulin-like [Trichomycterus rosablanca]|uniref:cingulin-like n=1 Tax=Trichomycterus rosablanca TaxID=2290929 RepID=UPI002F3527D2
MWRFNDNLRTHLDERFVMERIWLEERLDQNQTNLSQRLSQKMALMKAEWRKEERMRREQEEKTRPDGNVDNLKDILEKVKQMEERMMKKEETLDQKLLEVSETLKQQKEGYNLLQEEFEKIKIEREEMSARKLEIDRENESLRKQQEKLVAEEKNQLMKVIQQKEELVHQWEKFSLERQKLEEIKCVREQKQKEMEIRIMEAVKNEELAKQRAKALEIEKNMEIERMKIEMEKEAIKKEKEREQALQALRQTVAKLEMKEQKKKITREEKERKREMEEEWRTIEGEKKIIGEEWNAIENEKKKLMKQQKDVEKSIERSQEDIAYQDNEKRPKKIPKENSAEEKTQQEKRMGKDDQVTSQALMETEMAFENKWWEKKENEVAEWQAAEKKMTKDQKREEKERKREMEEEWRTIEGKKKIIGEEWNATENEEKKLIKQQKDVEKKTERSKKDIAYQDNEKRPKKIPKENSAEEQTKVEKRMGKDDQVTSQALMETKMAFENKWWEKNGNEVAEWQAAEKKMTKDQKRADVGTAPVLMESESKKIEKSMADKKKKKREEKLVRERLDTKTEMDSKEELFKTKKETASLLTCNSLRPPPTPSPMSEQGPALSIRNKAKTDKLRFNFRKNNLKEADIKPIEAKVVSQNVLITPKLTKEVDPRDEFDRELDALLDSETEKDCEKDLFKTKKGTAPLPTCSPLPTCNPLPAWTKTEQGSESRIQNKAGTDQLRFNLGKNNLKEADINPTEAKVVSQNVLISPKRTKEADPQEEFDRELDALLDSETEKDGEKDLFKTKKETAPLPTCKPDGEKGLFKTEKETVPLLTCSPPPACTKTEQRSGCRIQKKSDKCQLIFNFGKNNIKEADIKPKETEVVSQNVLITPKLTKEIDPQEKFDSEPDALLDSEMEKDGEKDLFKTKKGTAPLPTCSPLPTCNSLPAWTKTEQGSESHIQNKAGTDQLRFNLGKNNLKEADINPTETKVVSQNVLISPKRTKEADPQEEFDRELDALLDSETEKDGEKDLFKTEKETAPLLTCSPPPACTKTEQRSGRRIQKKSDKYQLIFNFGKNNIKEADIKPKETKVVSQNVLITPKLTKEIDPREKFDRELDALLDSL